MSVPPETRPGGPAAIRREEVLEAALEVMARKGFHDTSIADIAARARASRATVYQHFRDKQDVLAAIACRVEQRIIGAVDAWVALPPGPATGDVECRPTALIAQLRGMIDSRLSQVLASISANADAARLVLRLDRGRDGGVDDAIGRIDAHIVGVLSADIERAIAHGWARRCDSQVTARYLLGGIEKLIVAALDADRALDLDLAAAKREIGSLIFYGLAHPDLLREAVTA
jgi:AcrR family transcriptional regulator